MLIHYAVLIYNNFIVKLYNIINMLNLAKPEGIAGNDESMGNKAKIYLPFGL